MFVAERTPANGDPHGMTRGAPADEFEIETWMLRVGRPEVVSFAGLTLDPVGELGVLFAERGGAVRGHGLSKPPAVVVCC